MSWWNTATEAQKLAQIDGGIECGLTARQISIATGRMPESTLVGFAKRRGRVFGRGRVLEAANIARWSRVQAIQADRRAYLCGEPVDLWGNAEPQDEFAFDAVPQHHEEDAQA